MSFKEYINNNLNETDDTYRASKAISDAQDLIVGLSPEHEMQGESPSGKILEAEQILRDFVESFSRNTDSDTKAKMIKYADTLAQIRKEYTKSVGYKIDQMVSVLNNLLRKYD